MSEETYEVQEAAAEADEPVRPVAAGARSAAAEPGVSAGGLATDAEPRTDAGPGPAEPGADAGPRTAAAGGTRADSGADSGAEEDSEAESDEAPEGLAALELKPALEAVLMVVDEPATEEHLAKVLQRRRREISDALRELADEYDRQRRGFELRLVAEGWRFYTRAEYSEAVESFVLDGQQARLTQAALETLAVVAYRQPVSRSRVSAVRGVNCDGVMRTLLQRGLVQEAGTEPETGAILYTTTHYFLERLGLRGLDELPELAPFLPEADAVEGESPEGMPSFDVDDNGDESHDRTQTED